MFNPLVKDAVPTCGYPDPMIDQMGERIRQLRVARGMTQAQLAEKCGVTKSAVSQWESGSTNNIKIDPFLKLVEALGTDPHYLAYGADRAPERRAARRKGAA
jgi:transcriptional regulator with XRE-family HTH domain